MENYGLILVLAMSLHNIRMPGTTFEGHVAQVDGEALIRQAPSLGSVLMVTDFPESPPYLRIAWVLAEARAISYGSNLIRWQNVSFSER